MLNNYFSDSQGDSKNNKLASKLRNDFPIKLQRLIATEGDRYIVKGSVGESVWANCPWIAIFHSLITPSVKSGYYLVYLLKRICLDSTYHSTRVLLMFTKTIKRD